MLLKDKNTIWIKRSLSSSGKVNNRKTISKLLVIATAAMIALPFLAPEPAHAAISKGIVRLDSMSASAKVSGVICEKTSTVGSETSLTIDFPAQFTIPTAANWTWDVTAGNLPDIVPGETVTAWPGTPGGNASNVTGNAVTFNTATSALGDIATGTLYCLHFDGGATSSVGSANVDLQGDFYTNVDGTSADPYYYAVAVVNSATPNNSDTINLSARVVPTFSMVLNPSGTGGTETIKFNGGTGLLFDTVTNVTSVMTIKTNAINGWMSWVKDSTNGLYNTPATASIARLTYNAGGPTTDLSSSYGFGLDVDAGNNSPTPATAYDGSDANHAGGLQTSYKLMASKATATPEVVTGDQVTLNFRLRVPVTQKVGTYTDTVNIIAAGNF